ncbi:MAG: MFS transporter [Actinomycetota bacterium]
MAAGATMRRLVAPVYAPVVVTSIGTGMLIPILPLALDDAGASLRTTSIVLAAAGAGAVLGGLPVGALVERLGERRVLFLAIAVLAISSVALGSTDTAAALIAFRLVSGVASIGLRLSRQTYVTRRVESAERGRAMASIGGSFRAGLLIGPALGGAIADTAGFTASFVATGAVMALAAVAPLVRPADPPLRSAAEPSGRRRSTTGERDRVTVRRAMVDHRRLLLLAGVVPMLTMTVRDGRFVVLPLIGDGLGLSPSVVGAVVSVGTAADLVLFPVAGHVMDRFGRLAALLPCFGLIAIGLFVLALADSTLSVVIAGTIIGVGNGLGSGSLLTLGSDLAPPEQPGPFLAAFGVLQDLGKVAGPLLVGLVGSLASLAVAAAVLGGLAVMTAIWMTAVVGETSDGGGRLVDQFRAPGMLA